MNHLLGRSFRLVPRGSGGLSCDQDGVALGGVPLVRVLHEGGARWAAVCSIGVLGGILRLAYGDQPADVVRRCHRGLKRAASRLEAGDLAGAQLEALRIRLPVLGSDAGGHTSPSQGKPRRQTARSEFFSFTHQSEVTAGPVTAPRASVSSELCAPTRVLEPGDDDLPMVGEPAPPTPLVRMLETLAQEATDETPHTVSLGPFEFEVPPMLRGVMIHAAFEARIAALFGQDHAEVYYRNGEPRRGGAGSSCADAVIGPLDRPLLAVELKTSNARLTRRQYRAFGRNLPPGTSLLLLRLEAED